MLDHLFPLLGTRTIDPTCSCINTFCPGVDLYPCLGHFRVLQIVQRHPDKVALDLIQLLADVIRRQESIKDVACLDTLWRQVGGVVVKGFN